MTSQDDARLEAQLDYLRSDDRLRELAALAAELTPAERLAQAWDMCRSAAAMLERLAEDERRRIEATREVPAPDAAEVLGRLARLASPGRGQ